MKVKIIGVTRFIKDAIEIKKSERIDAVWERLEKLIYEECKGPRGTYIRLKGKELFGGAPAWEKHKTEPVNLVLSDPPNKYTMYREWIFRDYLIEIENVTSIDSVDDIKLLIKHAIFKKENTYNKIKKDVERFERFEKQQPITREQIPEDVRIYVWRRDNGKCVTCGSNRNIEFDHIIPISKGGGNTERNIQILCSDCNKKKSNNI
jgi:hypothetical protein